MRRELRDPRLGMVTLTEVKMSSDSAYATVYYSSLGGDEKQTQEILDEAADQLRGPVGRALGLRHSPELRFVKDELIEGGARFICVDQSSSQGRSSAARRRRLRE